MSEGRKKRKRKRKPGPQADRKRVAKGTRYIDKDLIALCRRLGIKFRMSLFGPGGFRCIRCGFPTAKRGTAGRNAMRAHHKAHLNEDKAGKTLKRSVIIVAGVLAGTLLWRIVSEYFVSAVAVWLDDLEPATLIGAGYALASIFTFISLNVSAGRLYYRHSERNRLFFYISLTIAVGLAMLAVAGILLADVVRINPLWYLCVLPSLLMAADVSKPLGLRRLRYRRRKVPSANYILRYKALTEVGDEAAEDIQHKISTLIRRKRLKIDTLSDREKLALAAIGIRISEL